MTDQDASITGPSRTRRPKYCAAGDEFCSTPWRGTTGQSQTCTKCSKKVHTSCYGRCEDEVTMKYVCAKCHGRIGACAIPAADAQAPPQWYKDHLASNRRDALLSFQLRGRLSEIHFPLIWNIMPELGWKYDTSGEYIAPNGANLGSSKAAMEKLDVWALQCLRFRIEMKEQRVEDELFKGFREIRKDLLTAIFDKCMKEGKPVPCFYFDEDDKIADDDDDDDDDDASKQGSKAKRETSVAKHHFVSATANEIGTEEYFSKRTQTKKNEKATRLKWPNPQDCVDAIRSESQADQIDGSKVVERYPEWKFLLSTNHSLLLYGFGSKQMLLNDFASKELSPDGDVLSLNGFDPDVNISQVLDILVQLFLNGVEPSPIPQIQISADGNVDDIGMIRTPHRLTSSIVQRAISIARILGARHPKPIYLVIHNIDGVGLRSDDAQRALSSLVINSNTVDGSKSGAPFEGCRVLRIVASVDQVDAPIFLWDVETMNNYSWVSGFQCFLSFTQPSQLEFLTILLLLS